jgi:hypothetical protein
MSMSSIDQPTNDIDGKYTKYLIELINQMHDYSLHVFTENFLVVLCLNGTMEPRLRAVTNMNDGIS